MSSWQAMVCGLCSTWPVLREAGVLQMPSDPAEKPANSAAGVAGCILTAWGTSEAALLCPYSRVVDPQLLQHYYPTERITNRQFPDAPASSCRQYAGVSLRSRTRAAHNGTEGIKWPGDTDR